MSKGVLTQMPQIWVQGAGWSKTDDFVMVSEKSMASRILCERHNHGLDPLDREAAKFFNAMSRGSGEFTFDGVLVERWLYKTMLNFATSGWMTGAAKGGLRLSAQAADLLVGRQIWPSDWGLHCVKLGPPPYGRAGAFPITDRGTAVSMSVAYKDGKALGLAAWIRHVPFFLATSSRDAWAALVPVETCWRPHRLVFMNGRRVAQEVKLGWRGMNGPKSFAIVGAARGVGHTA